MSDLTVAHGLLLGSLLALPLVLIRKRRLLLATGIIPPIAAALVILGTSAGAGRALSVRDLPSGVMDLERLDDQTALASLADGRLISIDLFDGRLSWKALGAGLQNPRGVAVIGEHVYVSELGPLPCPGWCMGPEPLILERSSGRIIRMRFDGDSLVDQTTILDGLPVVNYEHGPGDVDATPTADLVVSVGHVGNLVSFPGDLSAIDHAHSDWLGTVLRVDPDSGSVSIHSRGLRNVYGLTFSPDGRLFGVDNDGETLGTWRLEELLELREGADYGYPEAGTFETSRLELPIGIVSGVGAGGIEWDRGDLIVGTESGIERHRLTTTSDGRLSSGRPSLIDVQHCLYVAAIVRVDQSRVLAGCANGRLTLMPME